MIKDYTVDAEVLECPNIDMKILYSDYVIRAVSMDLSTLSLGTARVFFYLEGVCYE